MSFKIPMWAVRLALLTALLLIGAMLSGLLTSGCEMINKVELRLRDYPDSGSITYEAVGNNRILSDSSRGALAVKPRHLMKGAS